MATAIIVIVAVLLLLAAFRLWLTANRLDRLHVRTQAAWAALDGALARRIVAARALAATGRPDHEHATELRRLADAADAADRDRRDAAETALSGALAAIAPEHRAELADELSDAAERVLLARRFYNDAVRDTRALRASWFTRFFRLAGRALLPDYFELPEEAAAGPVPRTAGRVVLLDGAGRVLLLRSAEPDGDRYWFTPGGGLRPGEHLVDAACRELQEQTGVGLRPVDLVGPIWRRTARVGYPTDAEHAEFYFAARAPATAVDATAVSATDGTDIAATDVTDAAADAYVTAVAPTADTHAAVAPTPDTHAADAPATGPAEPGRSTVTTWRWLTPSDLAGCDDPIYPAELRRRLSDAQRMARTRVAPDIPETIT